MGGKRVPKARSPIAWKFVSQTHKRKTNVLSIPLWTSWLFSFLIVLNKRLLTFQIGSSLYVCASHTSPFSNVDDVGLIVKNLAQLLFKFCFGNAWIRGNSQTTSLILNWKQTQSRFIMSTLKTRISKITRYDSDIRKNFTEKILLWPNRAFMS